MARMTKEERESAETVQLLPRAYAAEFKDDFEKSEDEKEFEKFFEEMSQSNDYAKIGAYRVPTDHLGRPSGRKLAYLFEVLAGELTYTQLCSRIRDDHGTGTYRIQVRDEQNVLRKNQTISIEAPKNAEAKESAASMVSQISNAMQEQSRNIEEMLARNRPQSGFNFDKVISYVVPIATALGALGINFNREQPKSTLEMLKEFQMMKEIFSPSESDSESNIFSLMEKTVTHFGPALAAAVAAGKERGQMDAAGNIRRSLPPPQKPTEPNPEPDTMTDQVNAMRPQLEILLQQAQTGTSPKLVADFFLDNIEASDVITDEQIEGIEQFLLLDDCFTRCVEVVPNLTHFSEWFETWRAAMIEGLAEMLESENDGADETEIPPLTETLPVSHDGSDSGDGKDDATRDIDANSQRSGGDAGDVAHNVAHGEGLEEKPTA